MDLVSPNGPGTTFKIFGSPFSPAKGSWAFGYGPEEAAELWGQIPLDSDIVVTHTPAKYHCDERGDRRAAGCEALRNVLWRVRPRLAICGHVHEGRGAERLRWDLLASNVKYKEACVEHWNDQGQDNKKMSLVDLTAKSGRPIDNDGSKGDFAADSISRVQSWAEPIPSSTGRGNSGEESVIDTRFPAIPGPSRGSTSIPTLPSKSMSSATRGQGGIPPSQRCDLEALSGRMGRRETCIINAAIMASSWPRVGGKKFNKPIVVDIDLPVWEH